MSSYISTYSMSSALLQSVLNTQQNLATVEQEVSTGTYVNVGEQLGEATSQDLTLRNQQSLLQTIETTNNTAATRMSSAQTVMSNLQTTAQNFLNTLIDSTSQSTSGNTLQGSAQDALQSLITELNSSVNGEYIFGGINSGVAPMTDYYGSSSSANQTADNNAFSSTFGFSQSSSSVSSITGAQMQSFLTSQFAPLYQGANWTSDWSSASDTTIMSQISNTETLSTSVSADQPAFQDLAQAYSMVANLGTQNLSADALNTLISNATKLVQQGISGLTNLQTNLGLVQNDVTTANDQMSTQLTVLSTQISNLESVDTYQASTQVSELQTQLETAYSLTSQIQKLSLVNYI
jgi:flagellar hook-associated protein 3 FlgL